MKTPDLPEGKPSAPNERHYITSDLLKARCQAGEVVAATDYLESDRPSFWAAIARLRDDQPRVKPAWRTIGEHHVDGTRTRQRVFRLQAGHADLAHAVCLAIVGGGVVAIIARAFG
ncbi:MAG: hypothetical protein V5B38_11780 [Candidatus Accumulibacter propinquus]|jgi:hypothetical protein